MLGHYECEQTMASIMKVSHFCMYYITLREIYAPLLQIKTIKTSPRRTLKI